MAVLARSRREKFQGLRPMDPMRDLARVADLIEAAFADDLDRSGQSALRELRWLSRFKPILWWVVTFSPEHSDFLSGFVWEEEDQVVGNITVNKTSPGSQRWLISNVAVAEKFRGRGIGRALMYAALELVKEYNGRSVALQVRADNAPARHLYRSLQFKQFSGTTHLRFKRVPQVEPLALPPGLSLRPRRFDSVDTRQAYQLASVAIPASTQREWPLRHSRFRLGLNERINSFFRQFVSGGPLAYWVVEEGDRFVSTVNILPGVLSQPHRLELIVHPNWRGRLEKPLISRALNFLASWRKRSISIKHPADHSEAIDVYKGFGAEEVQTLLWMKQDLSG